MSTCYFQVTLQIYPLFIFSRWLEYLRFLLENSTLNHKVFLVLIKKKRIPWINVDKSLVAQSVKNLPAVQETWVQSLVRKIPWRRKWQPTLVFLLGKSHRQRSLAGCSPWGHKSRTRLSDWTELNWTEYVIKWAYSKWNLGKFSLTMINYSSQDFLSYNPKLKWNEVKVALLCPTLCDPMDSICSLAGSSLHGIIQARILAWVAISFSRGSSWLRDQIRLSCIVGGL